MKRSAYSAAVLLIGMYAWTFGGSVQVPDMEDEVTCVDGRRITGTVICAGVRRIIVLVDELEVELLPSEVRSIRKVEVAKSGTVYLTGKMDGTLKILGRGSIGPGEPGMLKPSSSDRKTGASADREKKKNEASGKKKGAKGNQRNIPENILKLFKKHGGRNALEKLQRGGKLDRMLKHTDFLQNGEVEKILEHLSK